MIKLLVMHLVTAALSAGPPLLLLGYSITFMTPVFHSNNLVSPISDPYLLIFGLFYKLHFPPNIVVCELSILPGAKVCMLHVCT